MPTGLSELLELPGLPWPVELRRHGRARAVRLRIDEARGRLILTLPARGCRRTALRWAERQAGWAANRIGRLPPGQPLADGAVLTIDGEPVRLRWDPAQPRSPRLADAVLQCGGPAESFPRRIEQFLRSCARQRLSALTEQLAAAAGVTVRSVSVGDATSRWGSCSASGAIRYNWRIVMAPPHLQRWLVAHEVAHRRHLDHGRQFKVLEAQLYGGDVAAARAELRNLGPRLKRIGLTI